MDRMGFVGFELVLYLPPHHRATWQMAKTCGFYKLQLFYLVVSTPLKNMLVKMASSSPIFGLKIPKIFELPPPTWRIIPVSKWLVTPIYKA